MTSEQADVSPGRRVGGARPAARPRASPTRRTARSGSAPPSSATTWTACSGSRTAATPTSCPTSPTTSTSSSAASSALIDVWGADHHGYIPRMRAVLRALGFEDEQFDVVLVQLVKVVRGGEEVKMSKRAGDLHHPARPGRRGGDGRRALVLPVTAGRLAAHLRHRARQAADRREPDLLRADGARPAERDLPHGRASSPTRWRARSTSPRCRRRRTPSCSRSWRSSPEVVAKAAREREPHRVTTYLHELATRRARLVPPHAAPWARPRRSSTRGCSSRAPRASSWPTASPCSASPPPTGCDR